MKKKYLLLLVATMLFISGCGNSNDKKAEDSTSADSVASGTLSEEPETSKEPEKIKEPEALDEAEDESAEPDQSSKDEASYEVTYQSVKFHQDSIGTIWSQAIFEVTNTGKDALYLDYGSYELEAKDGTLIHTASGTVEAYPQIIEPGEKGYYYEEQMMSEGTPTEDISIAPRAVAKKATVENVRFEVSDTEIYDKEYGNLDLHGRLTNTSNDVQSMVTVAAILYNENNEPIGQLFTILLDEIQPGEQVGFELESMSLPEGINTQSVANYEVFAYPVQYQY